MIDDRFLPRVWTDEGYYYPIFSELGITYENKNLPFTKENLKDINWAFRWRFNENVDMEYINTLEQCTGLKDKNGKLIYEGDIVELTRARNNGWMVRGTRLEVKYNIDRYCGFGFDDGYALTEKCAKNCIVIGNIHENADLIKVGGK